MNNSSRENKPLHNIADVSLNSGTEKLYYKDSHMKTFSAKCISCSASDLYSGMFEAVFDRTAFFPEGGGQCADTGFFEYEGSADPVCVSDVRKNAKNGVIVHYTSLFIPENTIVTGNIDFDARFRRMQNHSGEHIVSGLIHSLYGFENVGFHMGDEVTLDFNGVLTKQQISEIEYLANQAVVQNKAITTEFISADEAIKKDFRSKIDFSALSDAASVLVRLVKIDGYDICACCAPHVSQTGEIGIIRLLDFMNYKGGVRIFMKCGFDALDDYNDKYETIYIISSSLSVKHTDVSATVLKLENDFAAAKHEIFDLKKKLISISVNQALPDENGCALIFVSDTDNDILRFAANSMLEENKNIKTAAVFSVDTGDFACGNDDSRTKSGDIICVENIHDCKYLIASSSDGLNLKDLAKKLNSKLCGKGGGRDNMVSGVLKASREKIEAFFKSDISF